MTPAKSVSLARSGGKKRRLPPDLLFYCLLLVFPLLQFSVFYVGVNFNSFLLAFENIDFAGNVTWTTNNFTRIYQELTTSNFLLLALKNSLIIYGLSTIVGTVLAVLFSYFIYKKHIFSGFFKVLLFLPSILPEILMTIIFKFFANEAIPGYIYQWFGTTVKPLLVNADTRFWVVCFYNIWISFGPQVLVYSGAMTKVSPDVIEASRMDGAGPSRELWQIVFPEILPTVSAFLIAGAAGIFTSQAHLFSFYGTGVGISYEDYTLGYYLFYLINKVEFGTTQYPYAAALGLCLTAIALPLTFLLRKGLDKLEGSK